ncbi:MAG: DUF559 domain-containing protein [Anaerolineae bacterium]|nr:DUF559 domain-containing protein [Anaerolineae bacterium]
MSTEKPLIVRARQLRHPQTPAEGVLWARLRDRRLGGYKFRRQHPVGRFIVDFFCDACHLVVEIDGDSHLDQVEYDAERTAWLEAQGYRVIRFTNREVQRQTAAVLEVILQACGERNPHP